MTKNRIKWVQNTAKYSNEHFGYVGKYICFSASWNSSRSKNNSEKDIILTTSLSGLKKRLGDYNSNSEAFNQAEKILRVWLENANLIKR